MVLRARTPSHITTGRLGFLPHLLCDKLWTQRSVCRKFEAQVALVSAAEQFVFE
jgi:hypothetical protein